MKFFSFLSLSCVALATLPAATSVQAHGYLTQPASRAYLCRLGENSRCGNVQYEPQSVEGPDRYPQTGPADGTLAAAGLAGFAALNEQHVSRWSKRALSTGWQSFSWRFTAAHSSRDFRYYLTKTNWNPNAPLTRAQFDAKPFCEQSGGNRQPPQTLTHSCLVPDDKQGYHVILAVWDVADTPMSFYNVADVMISGKATPTPYVDVGDLVAEQQLHAGDTVQLRFFAEQGELTDLAASLTVQNDQDGEPSRWSLALAELVNQRGQSLRVGVKNSQGQIQAVAGRNDIFATKDSGVVRAELTIVQAPVAAPSVTVDGLAHTYTVTNQPLVLDFSVYSDQRSQLSVSLNSASATVHAQQFNLEQGQNPIQLRVPSPLAGHYSLTLFYTGERGGQGQQSFHLQLASQSPDVPPSGGYDYVFGEQLRSYKAGTKVLQKKTGGIYQCRPWPNEGYCVQWSPGATQFEPGVGSHWREAWIAL